MEKAAVIISDILQEILVQANEQKVEPVDSNYVIRYMNRFMAELDIRGISFGYTIITSPEDDLTVPDGIINGIIFNVALRIANSYDIPVSPSLAASAASSMDTMRIFTIKVGESAMPSILPIGSGNEGNRIFTGDHFFHGQPQTIDTETSVPILTETET